MADTSPTNLDHALGYLARGWSVIPIRPSSKEADTEALKTSPDDSRHIWLYYSLIAPSEEEVRAWFDKSPQDGIALVTGQVSGVLVLDADSINGCKIIRAALAGANVPMVETARGMHFYFRHPGFQVTNANFPLRELGIDIRADGGYVVLPPSKHATRHTYQWVEQPEVALPELPPVLLEIIKVLANAEPEGDSPSNQDDVYMDDDYDDDDWDDYDDDDDLDEDDFDDEEESDDPVEEWDIPL